MIQTEAATVRKHVVVEASIERAFTVFTDRSGWEAVTDGIDGPEGWPLDLDRYSALLKDGR